MINKLFKFVDKNSNKIIFVTSIILSIISFIYFYNQDLITAYGDSRTHLNISRRVVDGLTPGIAQLGGAWLPLLHILMLPTIWIGFMWHSGISGSLVNMAAYVIATYFLYRLVEDITKSKLSAAIAYLILALNINILYFQAIPMGEMLFISTLIVALFYLYKWQNTKQISSLLLSATFFLLTSLNRYEGWFVVVGAVIAVALVSLRRFGRKKAEGYVILFGTLASLGIMLWLLWQLVIFGHPFDFLTNEFAAGVNTARDIEAGLVPTYKNLWVSIMTQVYATVHTSGFLITFLAGLAILTFLIKNISHLFRTKEFILLLAIIPFLFEILVVYKGNVPVYVPEIRAAVPIPDFFNIRYALFSLPAIAIFISILSKQKIFLFLVGICILYNLISMPILGNKIASLKDGGIVSTSEEHLDLQAWFINNYDDGLILISAASSDAFIFKTNLHMDKFISEGSGKYWKESMETPSKYARWVLVQDNGRDSLLRHLNMGALNKDFDLQKKSGGFRLYKIKDN
ncbi:MAG: glycosyltransferase family 39 protein [Candidatus Omnitrophica bacterium]|nr:glycosyltransferase family 39 protein [Candidatus Omnitrophota bacterium]